MPSSLSHLHPGTRALLKRTQQGSRKPKPEILPAIIPPPMAEIAIPEVVIWDEPDGPVISVAVNSRLMVGWITTTMQPYARIEGRMVGKSAQVDIYPEDEFDAHDLARYLRDILFEWAIEDADLERQAQQNARASGVAEVLTAPRISPGQVIDDHTMAGDMKIDVWKLRNRIQRMYGYRFVDRIWKWMKQRAENKIVITHEEFTFDDPAYDWNLNFKKRYRKSPPKNGQSMSIEDSD